MTDGESGVTHQVVAQVVADALDEEDEQRWQMATMVQTLPLERDEAVQIELVAQERDAAAAGFGPSGALGTSTRSKTG